MAWEKFTETGKSFAPKVSLNPRGNLSFNDGARRRFDIGAYTHAILYYDRDTHKIGVELTNDGTVEGAIKLRKRRTGATIGAHSFLGHFDIAIKSTKVYDAEPEDKPNWIGVNLANGRERGTRDTDVFE